MHPFLIGLLSAVWIFCGGWVGMRVQRLLRSHHLSKEMQDLVKLSAGMIATLTALVLGLLVSSAKTAFDAINSGVIQGSAKVIYLDRTLARYGPDSGAVREQLKHAIQGTLENVWPAGRARGAVVATFENANGLEVVRDRLYELAPQTEVQHLAFNQAQQLTADLGQNRWFLVEEAHNRLPAPLLVILVFWLFLLFMSFGLFAPKSRMAFVVLAVGACAVSAAIFLVLELGQPFEGLIQISSDPIRNALGHLGK